MKEDIDWLVEHLGNYLKSLICEDFCEETDTFLKVEEDFEQVLKTLSLSPYGYGDLNDRLNELETAFDRMAHTPRVILYTPNLSVIAVVSCIVNEAVLSLSSSLI